VGLTGKQEKFVQEYLRDLNATQAALRSGYSPKTAYSIGSENLKKPEIIEALRNEAISAEEDLIRLTDIARGNITDLMDVTTSGFSIELMTEDESGNKVIKPQTKLIKKIKQKVTTIIGKKENDDDKEIVETELELYSALEAMTTLGKYHKLFVDRHELTGKDGEAIKTTDEGHNRAISKLADALREIVPGKGAEQDSEMDTTE